MGVRALLRLLADTLFGPLVEPAVPPAPSPVWHDDYVAQLPSVVPDVAFDVVLTTTVEGRADRQTVRERLRQELAARSRLLPVTEAASLAGMVDTAGRAPRQIPGLDAVVVSLRATVLTNAEALARTAEHQRRAGELVRLEAERRARHAERVYLRDEIFSKPDLARMYWHTEHPNDLETLAGGRFEAIAQALTGGATAPSREPEGSTLATTIERFLGGLQPLERTHLIRQLPAIFRAYGQDELVDELPPTQPPRPRSDPNGATRLEAEA
ncbi:hypothetical protein [Pilimelia columellifera]|uniref:Uncharacterized protein n=1 Tax=Pilimelia columellifera subsp. columellifera TaxID=706583 RepID=A0ABP6AZ56_9ACTN